MIYAAFYRRHVSFVFAFLTFAVAAQGQEAVYRINCGGSWYLDSASHVWEPDENYILAGLVGITSAPIGATSDDGLYQSERYAASWEPDLKYQLPVSPGTYLVRLHFAEIYDGISGQNPRVFDVIMEGYPALSAYNIFNIYGYAVAAVEEFSVTVSDSMLDITFLRIQENPKVSAIEVLTSAVASPRLTVSPASFTFGDVAVGAVATDSVLLTNSGTQFLEITSISLGGSNPTAFDLQHAALPISLQPGEDATLGVSFQPDLPATFSAEIRVASNDPAGVKTIQVTGVGVSDQPGAALRINAGGGAYTDAQGNVWQSDAGLFNTGSAYTTTGAISGTASQALYQSERYAPASLAQMVYSIPVASGQYTVNLHFAEIYFTSPGQRVFSVRIEGQTILNNFDIVAQAGPFAATTRSFNVAVNDGALTIQFIPVVENPKISAIEVTGSGASGLSVYPAYWDFGSVPVGTTSPAASILFTNNGPQPLTISTVEWQVLSGTGQGFVAAINGAWYNGGAANVTYATNVVVAPWSSVTASVTFAPGAASSNSAALRLSGAFGSASAQLSGTGGTSGDSPLRVIINKPAYMIDYDMDGFAGAYLWGDESYSTEPGRRIVAWQWQTGGAVYSNTANGGYNFPVGDNPVTLTIWDDSVPPKSASATAIMKIAAGNAVPGTLVQFYDSGASNPASLLDSLRNPANYATKYSLMYINGGSSTIVPSPFSGNVLVQLLGQIDISAYGNYRFQTVGGAESRLFLNGAPLTGQVSLSPGRYALEARFAVPNMTYLPAFVEMSVNGGPFHLVPAEITTHSQLGLRPVINEMPAGGSSAGGYEIMLFGMVLAPLNDIVVRWGSLTIPNQSLVVQGSSVRFIVPPGSGSVNVTLQNSTGVSNVKTFTYTSP